MAMLAQHGILPGQPPPPLPRPPPIPIGDHFKCYQVTAKAPGDPVTLFDQFFPVGTSGITTEVLQPFDFCNWVIKNGTKPVDTTDHLKLYGLNISGITQIRTVTVFNQFFPSGDVLTLIGPGPLNDPGPHALAVPTRKLPLAPPTTLDHYLCYQVEAGHPANVVVSLQDEFDLAASRIEDPRVLQPFLFCNPTVKVHKDKTAPILHPDLHYTFYAINDPPPGWL